MNDVWAACRRGALVVLFASGWLLFSGASAGAQSAPAPDDFLVPGGTAALLRAAGIRAPVEPRRALLVLARTLHGPFTPGSANGSKEAVAAALQQSAAAPQPAEAVPGLLPAAAWWQALGRRATGSELVDALVTDPRSAFLYVGLFSLDDETLAFLAARPAILRDIYQNASAAFAAYGEGVRIRDNRIDVPGGSAASAAWEGVLHASPDDPARFLPALMRRGGGRLAALFEALGRLDAPHLAFALGPSATGLPALIASVEGFEPQSTLPFVSWDDVDPGFVLEHVRVGPGGWLASPARLAFWETAFGIVRRPGAPPAEGEISAAWLVDRLAATPRVHRRTRFDAFLFAQRRTGRSAGGAGALAVEEAWAQAAAAFPDWQTLYLTLESIGCREPGDYTWAGRAARALASVDDTASAARRTAIFQGVVALVARSERVGALAGADAPVRLRELFAAAEGDPQEYPSLVLDILQRLFAIVPGSATTAEGQVLEGLAGPTSREGAALEWEGRQYLVDLASPERRRLSQLREMLGGSTLDRALALRTAIAALLDPASGPNRVREAADVVLSEGSAGEELERLLNFDVSRLREAMRGAAVSASREAPGTRAADARRKLMAGLETVLADALVGWVYALVLDPDAPLVAGDSPARRHDLGMGSPVGPGPWQFARVGRTSQGITGSLLGLDRPFARQSLRPTLVGLPPLPPTLQPEDMRGLAESALVVRARQVTDAGAASIAAAVRQGRARVLAAAAEPGDLHAVLSSAGVDGTRRRLARLAAQSRPEETLEYLSLAEVLRLGDESDGLVPESVLVAWGVAARLVDGSLGQWMPPRLAWGDRAGKPGLGLLSAYLADLHIRVAECLSDLRLPASLAPGVLALATWDLAFASQVANADEWLPVVRAAQGVSIERVQDYVSALAAGGPLVRLDARRK